MSTTLDYSLRLAQKHVKEYTQHDHMMEQHNALMEKCDACEEFLGLGISACRWLKQADETFREAAREGIDVSEELRNAIETLYRGWLEPCPSAEAIIKEQEKLGYPPENLDEFRRVCEEVKKRVRLFDMDKGLDDAFQGVVFDAEFLAAAKQTRTP